MLRYVNRVPNAQNVRFDFEVQLPNAVCRDWTLVDVGLKTKVGKIMVSEPAELVGFFEPSLGKDARMWHNAFGAVFGGAELDATSVDAFHTLSMSAVSCSATTSLRVILPIGSICHRRVEHHWYGMAQQ